MGKGGIIVRRNLKGAAMVLVIMLGVAPAPAAVTVNVAEGKPVTGDVVAKTDSNIVIKTATGTRTIAWRDVTVTTLKTLHPELYARLKEKADERARLKAEAEKKAEDAMLAEGKVKVGGKWITKEEAHLNLLRRMRINVTSREATKVLDSHKDDTGSQYYREKDTTLQCWGEVTFKIDDLEPTNSYTFEISVKHYRSGMSGEFYGSSSGSSSGRYGNTAKVKQKITVTGVSSTNIVLKTPEYERTKMVSSSSYGGTSKSEYGGKSAGYDIVVTVDGTLVYDHKKGDAPKYYHIGGR